MPFLISASDSRFPPELAGVYQPPSQLWCDGDASVLTEGVRVAVVGPRECTAYGEKVAREISRDLARHGVTVVSGLALGIDTAAHRGALEGGGRTIAVLGCGLDIPYPKENLSLRKQIVGNGAVLTEYDEGTKPAHWTFPQRNRIVSGLSRGVVVIEAGEKSGALITARLALDQGREVFAVPGPIHSPMSLGTNRLIQSGAKLVLRVEDILEELNIEISGKVVKQRRSIVDPNTDEGKILGLLDDGPRHMDDLVESSGCGIEKLSALLMTMEIEGKVKSLSGSRFERMVS